MTATCEESVETFASFLARIWTIWAWWPDIYMFAYRPESNMLSLMGQDWLPTLDLKYRLILLESVNAFADWCGQTQSMSGAQVRGRQAAD